MKTLRIAGVMAGTSADGVDVAVMRIGPDWRWRLESLRHTGYTRTLRSAILAAAAGQGGAAELARLHAALGRRIGAAVRAAWPEAGLDAIASHGQTVFHQGRHATLQLGDPASIAALSGVAVISDFRAADIAQGGEGAPLVPWADNWLFGHRRRYRVVLNLGGIANLTLLPAGRDAARIRGWDTGPANMALDALMEQISRGRQACDRGGAFAARGSVNPRLLASLLRHPFFRRPAPKSCGREQFGVQFVRALLARWGQLRPQDIAATLVALTATTVARALPREACEVIVAGGGVRNRTLMRALAGAAAAPAGGWLRSDALGVPAQGREAMAFALLGAAHLRGIPSNLPAVTGARRAVVLGSFTPCPAPGAISSRPAVRIGAVARAGNRRKETFLSGYASRHP
ncbi:MAG: anhydro-N-acetylmuramic acid kinase [Terriglobales bacterium]